MESTHQISMNRKAAKCGRFLLIALFCLLPSAATTAQAPADEPEAPPVPESDDRTTDDADGELDDSPKTGEYGATDGADVGLDKGGSTEDDAATDSIDEKTDATSGDAREVALDEVTGEAATGELAGMDLEQLLNITVATKTVALSLEEVPSIVTVVTREQIDRYGYRNIAEALADVSGLYVIDDTSVYDVAIRGIHAGPSSYSRIAKFMIDGRPVQYLTNGGALLGGEYIPMEVVERIEIIRGPASTLYGANAYLGVVNVVTRKLPEDVGFGGRIGGNYEHIVNNPGGSGSGYAAMRLFEESRPLELMLSFSGAYRDLSGLEAPRTSPEYETYRGQTSEDHIRAPLSGYGKASWDTQKVGRLELAGVWQRLDSEVRFGENGTFNESDHLARDNHGAFIDYYLPLVEEHVELNPAETVWDVWTSEKKASDNLNFHAWGRWNNSGTRDDEMFDVVSEIVRRDRDAESRELGLELDYTKGLNNLLVGFEMQRLEDSGDHIRLRVPNTDDWRYRAEPPDSFEYNSVGAFSQLVLFPIERVGLTTGFRYDASDQFSSFLSERAGLVLKIMDGLYTKLLFGTSYMPPAPDQLQSIPLTLQGGIEGNSDLEAQTAKTLEMQIGFKPLEQLETNLSGYYTEVENRIDFVRNGQILQAVNLSGSTSYGIDADIKLTILPFFSNTQFSWQNTAVGDPSESMYAWDLAYGEDAEGGKRPPGYPEIMAKIRIGATFPQYYFEVSTGFDFYGSRKSSIANIIENGESYTLPPYHDFDLHIRTVEVELFRDRPTDLALHLLNIFDERHSEGGYKGVDTPSLGRVIYLSLRQTI